MMRCRTLFMSLLAVMAASFHPAKAQDLFVAGRAESVYNITTRWSVSGNVVGGHAYTVEPYGALFVSLGGSFRLSKEATLAAHGSLSYADYANISNEDLILRLKESIQWRRASGFFFGFFLEQRRLIYKPSGYKLNASCLGATAGYEREWTRPAIVANGSATIIANSKCETPNATFIQRVKLSTSVSKRIGNMVAVGLDFTHMLGGHNQIYAADRDGMSVLAARVQVFFGRRATPVSFTSSNPQE